MRIKRFGVCIAALCAAAAVSAATETGDKGSFWLGMTLEQTEKALADHTRQTLRLLKDNGISVYPYWTPEWNAEDDYRLGAFSRNMPTVIMDAFKEAASSAR